MKKIKDVKENVMFYKSTGFGNKILEKKRKKIHIKYYTKEEFEEIKKKNPIRIVGSTCLSKYNEKDYKDKKDCFCINDNEYSILQKEKGITKGFFNVTSTDNNVNEKTELYIRFYKSKTPLIIFSSLLLSIILLLSIYLVLLKNDKVPSVFPNLQIDDGEDWDNKLPNNGENSKAEQETIKIPGYGDLVVNEENPEIKLINQDINTVYFVYTIINADTDQTIYETKAISPGKMHLWNAKESLEEGTYNLIFKIAAYDIKTQAKCNGVREKVILEVK